MAKDMEKLQSIVARHANKMKDVIEDQDAGELGRATRVLCHGNDLVDELMMLVNDMIEKRLDEQDRDRDRYENDRHYDSRDRRDDRYRGRDGRNDRGRDGRGRGGTWNGR